MKKRKTDIRTERKMERFEDIWDAMERMGMEMEEAFRASGFMYGPTGSLLDDWIEFVQAKRETR